MRKMNKLTIIGGAMVVLGVGSITYPFVLGQLIWQVIGWAGDISYSLMVTLIDVEMAMNSVCGLGSGVALIMMGVALSVKGFSTGGNTTMGIVGYVIAGVLGAIMSLLAGSAIFDLVMSPFNHRPAEFLMFVVAVMIIGHLLMALVPSGIASSKGRSYGSWYAYGFFFPLIAFIHSLLIEDYEGDYKVCPYCAERVKKAAKVCRYCGKELTSEMLSVQ